MSMAAKDMGNIGVSGALGFVSGYALKTVGKGVAVLCGVAFITLQALQYYEVININYKKAEQAAIQALDQDGDGKLTTNDLKVAKDRLQKRLSVGMPSAATFGVGFCAGLAYA